MTTHETGVPQMQRCTQDNGYYRCALIFGHSGAHDPGIAIPATFSVEKVAKPQSERFVVCGAVISVHGQLASCVRAHGHLASHFDPNLGMAWGVDEGDPTKRDITVGEVLDHAEPRALAEAIKAHAQQASAWRRAHLIMLALFLWTSLNIAILESVEAIEPAQKVDAMRCMLMWSLLFCLVPYINPIMMRLKEQIRESRKSHGYRS